MPGGTDIRWIAFDAVGTLIAADPPVADVYHHIGRKHGSRISLPEVQHRFRAAFSRCAGPNDCVTSEAIERAFWQRVVEEVLPDVTDRESCFAELYDWFAGPSAWRCFDDVAETLEALHQQGYRMALASNFDSRLHSVRAGLRELTRIETCVVSSEVGRRKPGAGFFAALTQACGCRPEEILMVGDDAENDIGGAVKAGLPAILLDRQQTSGEDKGAGGTICSLSELAVKMGGRGSCRAATHDEASIRRAARQEPRPPTGCPDS